MTFDDGVGDDADAYGDGDVVGDDDDGTIIIIITIYVLCSVIINHFLLLLMVKQLETSEKSAI